MTMAVSLASVDATFFPSSRSQGFRPFRPWKRRCKLKPTLRRRKLALCRIRSQFDPANSSSRFEDLFQGLVSHLPHTANPLPLAALGFASGLAVSLSDKLNLNKKNLKRNKVSQFSSLGEWILFSSPTPFNRFVLLRCPSLLFENGEFLEDVNDRLVKQERHFVRLDRGKIQLRTGSDGNSDEEGVERVKQPLLDYSRICVQTDDGGVVSLDWPANLDLNAERGLDTTILLIPGSTEGSTGENVRSFALECLKKGFFPVVMNPRGCAGSPLTTPRLFSAADSDDISAAMQYLSRARPWSTFMSVGWGYGANMLTKYLAEVGEKTPLTAAACIENPFDLEEATRSYTCSNAVNEKLLEGLKDILRSNKALFQGRSKAFDIEKALTAESVRDFEAAISMVSYGFDTIEEFYEMSSTRSMVIDIKVPVLFIQSDDGTVPLFSIPRGMIAENPFSSLLLCSSTPSGAAESINFVMSWSQELAVEWLAAVELALLKGRHPLLKDLDVPVNPSTGLALVDGWASDEDEMNGVVDISRSDDINGYMLDSLKAIPEVEYEPDLRYVEEAYEDNKDISQENDASQPEAEIAHEESGDDAVTEKGQVLHTAQVVMHMLDATMPGTLKEEDKAKVLEAVGQGETLINALQDAVPEDVRGRLTSSVNGILQTHGKNLNFDALKIDKIANMSSDLRMNIERKLSGKGSDENKIGDVKSLDPKNPLNDHSETQEKGTKSFDVDYLEPVNQDGALSSEKKDINESQNILGNNNRSASPSDLDGELHELPGNENSSTQPVRPSGSEEASSKKENRRENGEIIQQNMEQDISSEGDFRSQDISEDKSGKIMTTGVDEAVLPANPLDTNLLEKQDDISDKREENQGLSEDTRRKILAPGGDEAVAPENPPDTNLSEKQDDGSSKREGGQGLAEDNSRNFSATGVDEAVAPADPPETDLAQKQDVDGGKRDEQSVQMNLEQHNPVSGPKSSSFNVSQALDTLTDLDDSTQVAVNSVFGVIEEMINQLENKKEDETERVENADVNIHLGSVLKDVNGHIETPETGSDAAEGKPPRSIISTNKNGSNVPLGSNTTGVAGDNEEHSADELSTDLVFETPDVHANVNGHPLSIAVNGHSGSPTHLVSKLKKAKNLDVSRKATLSLDYLPEERQWKLLDQQIYDLSVGDNDMNNTNREAGIFAASSKKHTLIEPSYTVIDSERQIGHVEVFEKTKRLRVDDLKKSKSREDLAKATKGVVLQTLKDEVVRRLCMYGTKEINPVLANEIEVVASAVTLAVWQGKKHTNLSNSGQFDGGHIIEAISTAVKNTKYLRQLLPVGVLVGSSLASLRNFYNVISVDQGYQHDDLQMQRAKPKRQLLETEASRPLPFVENGNSLPDEQQRRDGESTSSDTLGVEVDNLRKGDVGPFDRDTVMVGAMTAALGATAFLTHEQDIDGTNTTCQNQSKAFGSMENIKRSLTSKLEDADEEKPQSSIISSLAEKAMSVAGPVVPTKEDGELDHERLVTMLTELGQRGGMLRLVGKLALLWGGIRGAMSLTDRLIKFLKLAERPLVQRILGFIGMVLVLWSPVVIPLIPTLVHNWTTNNTSRFVQFACITGLYAAATLLIVIWGKRIRGYENPLKEYGLDLASPYKIQEYLVGLSGGVVLVFLMQSVNVCLGVVEVNWPSSFITSGAGMMMRVKSWGKLLTIVIQGIVTATLISSVEELVYRSWLPEEISADLGYHRAIILSALAFSLSQRSLQAIPGLWLLSLCLAGVRQRELGSLYSPIGLRTGVVASCYVLQTGEFLISKPNMPLWLTGTNTFQPFSGAVGFLFSLLLAIMVYPRQSIPRMSKSRIIRE